MQAEQHSGDGFVAGGSPPALQIPSGLANLLLNEAAEILFLPASLVRTKRPVGERREATDDGL